MSDAMNHSSANLAGDQGPHFQAPDEPSGAKADRPNDDIVGWEEVEEGRFLPRRVRGSCVGRALG